jgi:hypothetical protein
MASSEGPASPSPEADRSRLPCESRELRSVSVIAAAPTFSSRTPAPQTRGPAASRSIRTPSLFLRVCVDGRRRLGPVGQIAEENARLVQLRQNERAPILREQTAEGD